MRRLLWLPVLAIALACGGGGDIFGNNSESYPWAETLSIEFVNTSATDTNIWMQPETLGATNLVVAGTTRTINVNRTWTSSSQVKTFTFHSKQGAGGTTNVQLTIDGHEAHADNFSGFRATWNGASLGVVTK